MALAPAHWVALGMQVPMQDAMLFVTEHTPLQGVEVPQPPVALQSAMPPLLHSDSPGAQLPVQLPLTHVWWLQGVAVPHIPVSLHFWTPLFEHWVEAGMHVPQEPGSRQMGVGAAQVVWTTQSPLLSQLWMEGPRQRVSPGPQDPPHVPERQVLWGGQGFVGRRHWTQVFVEGSQTPASPQSTPSQGPASTPPSDPPLPPPPVDAVLVVPPEPVIVAVEVVPPPTPKPPYCGKPHDAKTATKVTTNAAEIKRKDRTIALG
jgi:hypothetical protein